MTDSVRRCAYLWGVRTAGIVTFVLYGALWLGGASGEDFVDLTILLALVCLSPGCLVLGWVESGVSIVSSASEMGVVLDADARRRAGDSTGSRLVPLGFLLTGIGVQGILLTAFVTIVR
ncbi:hypothetical protein [Halosimplex amylolyticum]|uniref:hypothetical protein n=1 Tax=Halosimplex amylolyticum TaxID=3396616 RepID=UPI003F55004D